MILPSNAFNFHFIQMSQGDSLISPVIQLNTGAVRTTFSSLLKLTQVHLKPLYQGINLQQVQDQCSVDMTAGVDAQL